MQGIENMFVGLGIFVLVCLLVWLWERVWR